MTFFFLVVEHARDLAEIYENLFCFVWRTPVILRKICKRFGRRTFFFGDHLQNCVLSLRPWPLEFLSLASRGSVLAKLVLGLGVGLFCALGLEPSVVYPTSDWNRIAQRFVKSKSRKFCKFGKVSVFKH